MAVALLAALASCRERPSTAQPLLPHDAMSLWRDADPAQKQATAEAMIRQLRDDGFFGPRTLAAMDGPQDVAKMADELSAALDAAVDRDRKTYVSPSQSMYDTARRAGVERGWDK